MGIEHFRGVYMRDRLPSKCLNKECGILNLDSSINPGSHWTAYYRTSKNNNFYFDSLGNLAPPKELIQYLNCENVQYNTITYQSPSQTSCGYWCLLWLKYITNNS